MRMCSTNYSMIGTLLPDISSVNAPTLAENGSRTWSSRGAGLLIGLAICSWLT